MLKKCLTLALLTTLLAGFATSGQSLPATALATTSPKPAPTFGPIKYDNATAGKVVEDLAAKFGISYYPFGLLNYAHITATLEQTLTESEAAGWLNQILDPLGYKAEFDRPDPLGPPLTYLHVQFKVQPPVFVGADPAKIEMSDGIITQVIPLQSLYSVRVMIDLIPIFSPNAEATANSSPNSIIITDTSANVHRLVEVLAALDHISTRDNALDKITLRHANAAEAAAMITATLGTHPIPPPPRLFGPALIYATSDPRSNTVVLTGPPEQVKEAITRLKAYDAISEIPGMGVQVITQNLPVEGFDRQMLLCDLASFVFGPVSPDLTGRGASGGTRTAGGLGGGFALGGGQARGQAGGATPGPTPGFGRGLYARATHSYWLRPTDTHSLTLTASPATVKQIADLFESLNAHPPASSTPHPTQTLNFIHTPVDTILTRIADDYDLTLLNPHPIPWPITLIRDSAPANTEQAITLLDSLVQPFGYMIEIVHAAPTPAPPATPPAAPSEPLTLLRLLPNPLPPPPPPVGHFGNDPAQITPPDDPITQIIPLQTLNAQQLATTLAPLEDAGTQIAINPRHNTLIITDTPTRIRHLTAILSALDHHQAGRTTQSHRLNSTHAGESEPLITEFLGNTSALYSTFDPPTKTITLTGPTPLIDQALHLLALTDTDNLPLRQNYLTQLRAANPADLPTLLQTLGTRPETSTQGK